MYANTYSVRVVTGLWLGVHVHAFNKKGTLNQLIQTLEDKIRHKMHVNTQDLMKTYMYTIFQSYDNLINFSQTLSLSYLFCFFDAPKANVHVSHVKVYPGSRLWHVHEGLYSLRMASLLCLLDPLLPELDGFFERHVVGEVARLVVLVAG